MNQAAGAVNEQRQWDRLMAMARIGAIPGDGVNRACLTALDREARRLLIGWAKEIGASVSVDAAANLWLRRDGSDPHARRRRDRQPHGHPAERRPVRRHLRRDRRPGGADRAARGERNAAPPGRGGGMDQRGGRPLRPRLHGQHGLERLPPHRGVRRRRRSRQYPLCRRAGRAPDRRGGPAAPAAGRRAARLCRGAYRAGSAPGSRGPGHRRRHRHPGQPLVHRDAHRRDRACRHHAARAAPRRGAGHAARHRRAERA